MTNIFFAIGNFFYWSFKGICWLGNFPNIIFISAIFSFLIFWLYNILCFGSEDKKMK